MPPISRFDIKSVGWSNSTANGLPPHSRPSRPNSPRCPAPFDALTVTMRCACDRAIRNRRGSECHQWFNGRFCGFFRPRPRFFEGDEDELQHPLNSFRALAHAFFFFSSSSSCIFPSLTQLPAGPFRFVRFPPGIGQIYFIASLSAISRSAILAASLDPFPPFLLLPRRSISGR